MKQKQAPELNAEGKAFIERLKARQAARKGVPISEEEFFEKYEATDEEYALGMALPGQGE